VAVLFFSFDATAQQRLDGFSPNLHQKTSLRRYSFTVPPWKSVPHSFFVGAQDVHFLERKFRLCCFRTVAARKRGGILGKLKQMVQLQYLGYPHIYVWWNSVRVIWVMGAHKLCILANGPQRFTAPTISRKRQHVQSYQSQFVESWKYGLSDSVAHLGILLCFLNLTIFCLLFTNAPSYKATNCDGMAYLHCVPIKTYDDKLN